MSRLCSEAALVLEGGGLRAIMVLLSKQIHLQKDVAVDFADMEGLTRVKRSVRKTARTVDRCIVVELVGASTSLATTSSFCGKGRRGRTGVEGCSILHLGINMVRRSQSGRSKLISRALSCATCFDQAEASHLDLHVCRCCHRLNGTFVRFPSCHEFEQARRC
jgi:hypothetical protein